MSYPEYLDNIKKGIVTKDGHCPVTPLLIMLQGRWKSQLMYEMCIYDTVRFGQLKKELPGITNTMLTKGLRELEDDGLITRKQFNEIPPHVEYSLTEMGRDLLPVFYAIMNWGFKYEGWWDRRWIFSNMQPGSGKKTKLLLPPECVHRLWTK